MEKTYFKGELVSFNPISKCYHYGYDGSTPQSELDYYVAYILRNPSYKYLDYEYEIEVTEPEIIKILDKKYEFGTKYMADIIFEIVYDEFDKPYAKEIITGTVFPIVDQNEFTRTYNAKYTVKDLDNDDKTNRPFSPNYRFEAEPVHHIINPNILNIMFFVENNSYSYPTQIELDEYKKNFYPYTLFGMKTKQKNKELFNQMKKFYNNNTYKNNNFKTEKKPEEIVEIESLSTIASLMENIEFLLAQVGKIDLNKKQELEKKYNTILDSENNTLTLEPLTLQNLKSLEAELEFIIIFQKKNDQDIIETLDNIINEYDSNEKTPRTIKDIDQLADLFFKMQDSYSVTVQRKVIENLACIYIHEINENKDTIKLEDLTNSYFNKILKTIITYISSMLDNDIIENNIIINFNDKTPDYVLSLIKQIKFKQIKDKQKSMVN